MQIPYLFIPKNLDFSFPYLQGIPHLAIRALRRGNHTAAGAAREAW